MSRVKMYFHHKLNVRISSPWLIKTLHNKSKELLIRRYRCAETQLCSTVLVKLKIQSDKDSVILQLQQAWVL